MFPRPAPRSRDGVARPLAGDAAGRVAAADARAAARADPAETRPELTPAGCSSSGTEVVPVISVVGVVDRGPAWSRAADGGRGLDGLVGSIVAGVGEVGSVVRRIDGTGLDVVRGVVDPAVDRSVVDGTRRRLGVGIVGGSREPTLGVGGGLVARAVLVAAHSFLFFSSRAGAIPGTASPGWRRHGRGDRT